MNVEEQKKIPVKQLHGSLVSEDRWDRCNMSATKEDAEAFVEEASANHPAFGLVVPDDNSKPDALDAMVFTQPLIYHLQQEFPTNILSGISTLRRHHVQYLA